MKVKIPEGMRNGKTVINPIKDLARKTTIVYTSGVPLQYCVTSWSYSYVSLHSIFIIICTMTLLQLSFEQLLSDSKYTANE